jgi:hypothetical protein
MIFKEKENNVIAVENSPEKFPHSITASFTTDMDMYYFFRGPKYCYRKLILEKPKESLDEIEMHYNEEVYSVDDKENKRLINSTLVSHRSKQLLQSICLNSTK